MEADEKDLAPSYLSDVAATTVWIAMAAARSLTALGFHLAFCLNELRVSVTKAILKPARRDIEERDIDGIRR